MGLGIVYAVYSLFLQTGFGLQDLQSRTVSCMYDFTRASTVCSRAAQHIPLLTGKQKNLSATRIGSTSSFRENSREFCNSDDDEALQQAISLSLGVAKDNSGTTQGGVSPNSGSNVEGSGSHAKKSKANIKGTVGRMTNKKQSKSRVQLTEDEVVAYFFSFDEAGKGYITLRDLQRMVAVHDFTWTDMEIGHMIHSFDTDGDGQLSLAEFQTIVTRCQMFQRPKEC